MNKESQSNNITPQATKSTGIDENQEVPIQEQTSYAKQRHSSSNAFAKISAVAADQQRASAVDQATISKVPKDDQLAEDTRRKSANMVVTNVIRISGSELEAKQPDEKTQDSSKDTGTKKETTDQKRVIVREVSKDEQDMTADDTFVRNRQRPARTVLDPPDSGCITPASRITSENRGSSSDVNVRSLTIDHQMGITLPNLEVATFECVLQECLEHLSILRYVIPAEIDERWEESYKTIAQLYGVPDEPRLIFREDAGLLPLIPNVAAKIQRDRTYVYEVLKKTLCNIKNEKTFESLELEIDNIVKTQDSERELQINCDLWTEQAKQLQELIEFDELEFEENRKRKIELAQRMNADVDNSIFLSSSQLGYVERWEDAQLEKQELKLGQKEAELLSIKLNCEKLEKADQIVSGEVKTYLEANTKEMEDEIISWTSQYIEELERRQQEMSEFKDHIGDQLIELHDLTSLRDSRQAFIDEVLAEKERIREEEEYWREIHRVATLIQAHWRGYMVRKQIGPFKGLWAQLKKRKKNRKALAHRKTNAARGNKKAMNSAARKNK